MNIDDYNCPDCGHTSQAPLHRFAHGDAGLWVCPDCETAFQLNVEFVTITSAQMNGAAARVEERRIDQAQSAQRNGHPHLSRALGQLQD